MELLEILLGVFAIIIIVSLIFLITVIKDDIKRKHHNKIKEEYSKVEKRVEKLLNSYKSSIETDIESMEQFMDIILKNNTVLDNIPLARVYKLANGYLEADDYEVKEENILYKRKYWKGKATLWLEDITIEGYFTNHKEVIFGQFKQYVLGEEEVFQVYHRDGIYKVVHTGSLENGQYRPYTRTLFIDGLV